MGPGVGHPPATLGTVIKPRIRDPQSHIYSLRGINNTEQGLEEGGLGASPPTTLPAGASLLFHTELTPRPQALPPLSGLRASLPSAASLGPKRNSNPQTSWRRKASPVAACNGAIHCNFVDQAKQSKESS